MRITSRTTIERALANIAQSQQRLADLQERLATGRRINRPSDDPAGTVRGLAIRTNMARDTQYVRSIDGGVSRMSATEAALDTLTTVVQRTRELAVTGTNATLDQAQRSNIAAEVGELLAEAIAIGNTNFGGQYLFAGHKTTTKPFTPVGTPPTSVTYNGDSGVIERDISNGIRVQVNVPGDQVFSPTYQALIDLRTHLQTGDLTSIQNADLTALDGALETLLAQRGKLGATANRLEITRTRLESAGIADQTLLSEIEEGDLIETIVDLNAQENTYQAALAATARSVQSTLVQFLR